MTKYEVGDEVDLRVRVVSNCGYAREYIVEVGGAEGEINSFSQKQLDAGKLVPRPIKVGDTVTWGGRSYTAEVIAVVGDKAWVSGAPLHGDSVQLLSHLKRVK